MYGIGRAEAARFERPSKCFERPSKVLRATQQKGVGAVSVTRPKFPHFLPHGSGARPDLSFTPLEVSNFASRFTAQHLGQEPATRTYDTARAYVRYTFRATLPVTTMYRYRWVRGRPAPPPRSRDRSR